MTKCPHCCCDLDPVKGKPRSLDQLRRFFAVLRAMKMHWPETAEFQPKDETDLRKWALIKAGHRESQDIDAPFSELEPSVTRLFSIAVQQAMDWAGSYVFVRPHPDGGSIRVFRAKSIAFDKLGQAEFNRLNDEVEAVYRAETGLDPSEVLKQQERAA